MKLINFNLLKHMMALIKKVILQGYNAKLIIFRLLVSDLNLFKNSISHFKFALKKIFKINWLNFYFTINVLSFS